MGHEVMPGQEGQASFEDWSIGEGTGAARGKHRLEALRGLDSKQGGRLLEVLERRGDGKVRSNHQSPGEEVRARLLPGGSSANLAPRLRTGTTTGSA